MNKFSSAFNEFLDTRYLPLEPKFKVLLAVGLVLLPIVIFYFVFLSPNLEDLERLETQKVTLEQKLQRVKKKAANRERLRREVEETRIVFEEVAELLPSEKEIPQLLKDISALGRNAGLDFLAFKPGQDTPKDFYAEIPVNINVKGPYHNLGFFLDQVSKLERIVTVNNINMGSPGMDAGEMLLASSANLKTYRFTNKPLPQPKKK
ncbi:MAG TPA: type 4a pilus biogenesis protein PilO [Desulfopila sp.]|nr:type 4a pilus biogenesis protein PilO [Desulfopila sp.]